MSKGKLYELLAVETDLQGRASTIMNETRKVFNDKEVLFQGKIRSYKPFTEDGIDYPEERLELTTTVDDKLKYTSKVIVKYYDALLQKEATNQIAMADLVIDGEIMATSLPATFLLGMESRLKKLREMYAQIPTLGLGTVWELDEGKGKGVFVTKYPTEDFKTKKTIKSTVLYEAKFPQEGEGGQSIPAVIDRWDETENVGKYTSTFWSGMITPARKSELLDRIDKLHSAVKQARQRANSVQVQSLVIGDLMLDYINS